MEIEEMWDLLLKAGVNEQVLVVVADINGYNEQSMLDILYATYGYNDFNDLKEEMGC